MKKTIISILAVICLMIGTVYATTQSQYIEAFFNNIGIMIDGEEFIPKDANGSVIEPFIYNGTTYLPVRAIANAFDKDVYWNAENSTITLNDKGYTFLDSISIYEKDKELLVESYSSKVWYKSISDAEHGLYLYHDDTSESEEIDKNVISYKTDKKYATLQTTVRGAAHRTGGKLNIYGDNKKLIYSTPIIEKGNELELRVDISNESMIYIEFVTDYGDIVLDRAMLIHK